MPRKQEYQPSKIQANVECFICHRPYTVGLEHHHCIEGNKFIRSKGSKLGLWVWLCRSCHANLHNTNEHRRELEALAQKTYIADMKKQGYPEDVARELWFKEFGKFYEFD
jgi:Zn-finger protein